jgi:transcriptional regulator with XRE-family HTH domain
MTAEELRSERKARGWSQATLARKAGVDTSQVSRWEAGLALSAAAEERLALVFERDPGCHLRERDPRLARRAVERTNPLDRALAIKQREREAAVA